VTTFWGAYLTPQEKPFALDNSDNASQRCTVHLRLATIDIENFKQQHGANVRLEVTHEGATFVLCHLSDTCLQQKMDLYLNPSKSVTLQAVGNVGVTVVGEYMAWLSKGEINTILEEPDMEE
jgi:hypothetical protein